MNTLMKVWSSTISSRALAIFPCTQTSLPPTPLATRVAEEGLPRPGTAHGGSILEIGLP
jgi:hypothetical protein